MKPEEKAPRPEREQTDESLRTERERTAQLTGIEVDHAAAPPLGHRR